MKRAPAIICAIVLLSGAFAACKSEPASTWAPVHGPDHDPLGRRGRPDMVLPEYPRPQMVRERWLNLNGLWDYAITAKDAGRPADWDGQDPRAVRRRVGPVGRRQARRVRQAPSGTAGRSPSPRSGAAAGSSSISARWIGSARSGSTASRSGTHRGGYDPFTFDITDALKRGAKQEIVLRVLDPTDDDNSAIARGKQVMKPHGIFYTAVTGIWQTVWLEPVPETYIVGAEDDAGHRQGRPDGRGRARRGERRDAAVRSTVSRGQEIVAEAEVPAGDAGDPRDPAAASSGRPRIRPSTISRSSSARTARRSTRSRAMPGCARSSLGKDDQGFNRLFLNNEPLFEFGPLDQGWWPDGLYTAPTDAALRYDIETIKALGMNMLRKHVKVEPDRLYYWCDKLGLLVWQDMPSALYKQGRPCRRTPWPRGTRSSRANGRRSSTRSRTIRRSSCGCRSTKAGASTTPSGSRPGRSSYDPTRLVNNASGWTDKGVGDVQRHPQLPGPGHAAASRKSGPPSWASSAGWACP